MRVDLEPGFGSEECDMLRNRCATPLRSLNFGDGLGFGGATAVVFVVNSTFSKLRGWLASTEWTRRKSMASG